MAVDEHVLTIDRLEAKNNNVATKKVEFESWLYGRDCVLIYSNTILKTILSKCDQN